MMRCNAGKKFFEETVIWTTLFSLVSSVYKPQIKVSKLEYDKNHCNIMFYTQGQHTFK